MKKLLIAIMYVLVILMPISPVYAGEESKEEISGDWGEAFEGYTNTYYIHNYYYPEVRQQ